MYFNSISWKNKTFGVKLRKKKYMTWKRYKHNIEN